MLERDIDTHMLRRVVALKRFSLLESVELGELATLAQNLVEVNLAPGDRIACAADAMSLVIDGSITVSGSRPYRVGDIVGGLELLAGRTSPAYARAIAHTRILQLGAEDLFDMLDDNFSLLAATMRAVSALAVGRLRTGNETGLLEVALRLSLVDRLVLLRRQAPFARARLRALTTLAHASEEIAWPAGAVIVQAGELASASYVIASGTACSTARDATTSFGAGAAFGLLETLAARAHRETLEAVTPVRALVTTQAALLDVLEDHSDLGFAVLAQLAAEILDLQSR